jgi:hypothetical protein
MPKTRSNMDQILEAPLSNHSHRRIHSASALPDPQTVDPPSPSPSNLNRPENRGFQTPPSPILPPREITPGDLLAAMRDQQIFITQQQQLFQQERDFGRMALREQHDFMAEQQRQLMSLLVNRPPRSEDNQPSRTSQAGPKVRMADPPSFDGSIKETENFLSSLTNIFDSNPSSFPTDESKIRYSLTFLTGSASNWRKLLLREVSDGTFILNSWTAFEQRFRTTFGNPHLVDEARRKLWTIRQGSRTSEDFFLEFEELRLEADICENSLIMFLQAALRPSILNEVLRRDPPPTTYNEWKSTSLRADHNQRNSAATKSFHQQPFSSNSRSTTFIPFRPRQTLSHQPTLPQSTLSSAAPTKISLPQTNPETIKPRTFTSNKTANGKSKNCWKCGAEGHFSHLCPENSTNNKVRALFEQCEELDAAYVAASSGADFIRKLLDHEPEGADDEECRCVLERFINEHPVFVEYDE